MSVLETKELAKIGEYLAGNFLSGLGHKILATNYFSAYGELDIVTLDKDEVVFVEVKTRTGAVRSGAENSITHSKQRKLTLTAMDYLTEHQEFADLSCRFDAVFILYDPKQDNYKVEHLRNAFLPADIIQSLM